ncbi:ABC transporter ATP-binding protein [Paenibacillus sp.]|uniref:ABC transporter ATP-binding protein n=1 Tax=Paenibacillus sp. TaxID=58172 RepID=UPI002D2D7ADB|nr:ABC transporter ATP-binding protein [Paenibacillus sp.]HZG87498.1 ABC transporter ATP-binding protein [Paenibacillus sp.]
MFSRLHTESINVGYGDRLIVKDLSVRIPDRSVTTIVGPNGCGKSTLLKAMTRIVKPQSGAIVLDGKSITSENTKQLARKLAILPQTPEAASGLTVGELVSYGRHPHQQGFGRLTKRDIEVIDQALRATGTIELKSRPVDALSGGQRQRAWIAMALAQETDMIFLDEPTTYLDMAHQLEVLELLRRLNEEERRTIIMVLHDLNQAARYSDYMIAMKDGTVVKAGRPADIMQRSVLRHVFRVDADIGADPRTGAPMVITYNLLKGETEHDEKTMDPAVRAVAVH